VRGKDCRSQLIALIQLALDANATFMSSENSLESIVCFSTYVIKYKIQYTYIRSKEKDMRC
jgi:hypothetical protein